MKTGLREYMPRTLAFAAAFALSACGSASDSSETAVASDAGQPASASPTLAAAGAKPGSYAQCAACHAVEPGKHGVGPSLAGIVGKKAGSAVGFAYSQAMIDSGLVWDAATLDQYLTAPAKTVRGTKMSYAGMAKGETRAELIEYLKTLK